VIPKKHLDLGSGIIRARPVMLTGFVAGDCMYLQDCARDDAWLEGKCVELLEWI